MVFIAATNSLSSLFLFLLRHMYIKKKVLEDFSCSIEFIIATISFSSLFHFPTYINKDMNKFLEQALECD